MNFTTLHPTKPTIIAKAKIAKCRRRKRNKEELAHAAFLAYNLTWVMENLYLMADAAATAHSGK